MFDMSLLHYSTNLCLLSMHRVAMNYITIMSGHSLRNINFNVYNLILLQRQNKKSVYGLQKGSNTFTL
jgi:hypothetical protein